MKLLLDEMYDHKVAAALVERGRDVVSIQSDRAELRHQTDPVVFAAAQTDQRAVVTENAADYLPIVTAWTQDAKPHWGLILTTNRAFPRHRPGQAIRALSDALDAFLTDHSDDEPTSAVHWLQPTSR